ncbi:hypothetical protein [Gymnodinialimonas hymeniacidonis]|uniref:hypothetical protein n=1 Tax=Gymnodinialimonas hymeniacidonis TaxID=3126508 RepID=UPI0034C6452E
MTIYAFSSFTYSYLDRARVLAQSLRQRHPEWHLCAVVTDLPPDGSSQDDLLVDFDTILTAEDLLADEIGPRFSSWMFCHNIVEACTAVKGRALAHLLDKPDAEKVFFFDPDIAVFDDLSSLVTALDDADILLTPHQLDPEPRTNAVAIGDNEIASLKWGAYNLGFVGVANTPDGEGLRFAKWWGDRLLDWCQDNLPKGLFTDQKWCDLVPSFFDDVHVLRDPGCNVASWNLSQRRLAFTEAGDITVNKAPLRFFHFTKLGPVGDQMTRRYAHDNPEVLEVWAWYKRAVAKANAPEIPARYWHYGTFSNGRRIPDEVRQLYRDRADLRAAFSDPFDVENGFHDWLVAEGHLPALTPSDPSTLTQGAAL